MSHQWAIIPCVLPGELERSSAPPSRSFAGSCIEAALGRAVGEGTSKSGGSDAARFVHRPRERLRRLGPPALETRELLEALLGAGSAATPALETARRLDAVGLRALSESSVDELGRVRGLGPAQAARLAAALELGARAAIARAVERGALQDPHAAASYLLGRYSSSPVETFGMLALDVRHRVRAERVVSVGTLTTSLVHPREVFREAIVARAAAVIVFHNHPSGDPEPSAEDVSLTRRLVRAGDLLGIELLDHLVLGHGRAVSLKERGCL